MTMQTFNKVCRVLEPGLSPMQNTAWNAIDVQKQVQCSTNNLLARHSSEYRTFGHLFGKIHRSQLRDSFNP